MEQEKIYGIYSAGLGEEKVENFREWQFYTSIQDISEFLPKTNWNAAGLEV